MSWFKKLVLKNAQSSSSSGILISLIKGSTDEITALHELSQINDPETCNNISVLINDVQVQNKFPNSLSALHSLAADLKCETNNLNNNQNNTNIGIMNNTVQQNTPVQEPLEMSNE